jgi:hypothetical protein
VVETYIRAGDRRDIEVANLYAAPIGYLGEFYASSKGSKEAKASWFNPYSEVLYQRDAKEKIDRAIAQTFLALCKQERVPNWALELVNIRTIRAAAK